VRREINDTYMLEEELVEQKQLVLYVNNLLEKKLLERTLLKSRVTITLRERER